MLRATTSTSKTGFPAFVSPSRRLNSTFRGVDSPRRQNPRPQRRQQQPPGKYTVQVRTWERIRSPAECLVIVDYLAKNFGPVEEFKTVRATNNSVLVRFRDADSANRAAAHTQSIAIPYTIKDHVGGVGLEDLQPYFQTQHTNSSSSPESVETTGTAEEANQQIQETSENSPLQAYRSNDLIIRISGSSDLNGPHTDTRQQSAMFPPINTEAQEAFARWGGFSGKSPKMQNLVEELSPSLSSPAIPADTEASNASPNTLSNVHKSSERDVPEWEPLSAPTEHNVSSELDSSSFTVSVESSEMSQENVTPIPQPGTQPAQLKEEETPTAPTFNPIAETAQSVKLGNTQVHAANALLRSLQNPKVPKTKPSRPNPKARESREPFLESSKRSRSPSQRTQPTEDATGTTSAADQLVEPSVSEKKKRFGWF